MTWQHHVAKVTSRRGTTKLLGTNKPLQTSDSLSKLDPAPRGSAQPQEKPHHRHYEASQNSPAKDRKRPPRQSLGGCRNS